MTVSLPKKLTSRLLIEPLYHHDLYPRPQPGRKGVKSPWMLDILDKLGTDASRVGSPAPRGRGGWLPTPQLHSKTIACQGIILPQIDTDERGFFGLTSGEKENFFPPHFFA